MKSTSPNNKKATADKKSNAAFISKPLIKSQNTFPVVGIGASAGGLEAFKKLIKAIPEDSGMAFVLVQHLDPKHESLLPELLQKVTKIPVLEITDDIKVHPDHIYVIPSNKMMVATDGVLLLAPRPPKSNTERNLPIDLFFTSLAEVHQEQAIGVVLSGTASDGTQGLKAIKDHGGITFAQDEASAEYDGMPHSAVQAGVVDFILPPGDIPKKLLEVTNKTILSDEELQNIPKKDEDIFKQILSLLRIRKGVDFTYYKQTTVRRRILRRMVVNKNEETGEYLKFLRGNNPEQDLLYQDMLIPVTSFFRDKKVFENLCNHVFPAILANKTPGDITRIWVAGCSTGQEVYSFAICFKEFLGDHHERIQIFGTDISEPAIIKARTGLYEKSEVDAVSPERLKEYFTKINGDYQVNKSIRDMCVFAHHNFLKDPPFGKMDVITCRNVLIYMEPYLQKKTLTTFHYALNPKGFLLLGKSETTGGVPDLFAAVEKADKLYTRKDVPGRFMQVASQRSEQILNRPPDSSKSEPDRTDFQKTADDILLTKYTPAGVVVNETMDIVHFRGNTTNYLEQAAGKPSHNLLTMAKNGLGFELRNILHKAKTNKVPVVKENIPLSVYGSLRNISIEAVPLPNTLEPYYLVLFHDNNLNDTDGPSTGSGAISNRKKVSAKTKKEEKDIQIQLLEQELAQAREDMRSITEDQEASNEELQSANEELLSGSEELQSLNEELETSKEELQSTNEELTVLNHELISLNEQVTDARNYSESIVATLYQPLLVLDKHLRVKTANKAFYTTFKVNEEETEGVLIYDLGNRQWNIPELRTLLEEILPQKKQITDFEVTHNFTSIGERVILLSALELTREKKEEKLILLSIDDITESKLAQKRLEENEHRYHMMLMNSPFAFSIMKGKDMVVTLANDLMKDFWGKGQQVEGKTLLQVLPELSDQPFPAMIDKVYTGGEPVNANEILARLNRNGIMEERYFNIVYQPHFEADKTISGVITIAHEVTNQVLARKQIEDSNKRYDMMVMQSPFAFGVLKGKDMVITLANDSIKEMWGKGKEIEGKPLLEVLPEIKNQPFPALLNKVYTTGIPFYDNESLAQLIRNGKMEDVYFNFVYQPYREADETISGVAIIATEVSPQAILNKKIKASEEKFRLLVLQAPVAICVLCGEEYVIETMNEGMCEFWDRSLEQALNKPAFDVLPELRGQGIKELLDNVYHTGERYVVQELSVSLMRKGKLESIFVKFAYEPMREADGSISGVMCLAHEITEQVIARKKIEESEAHFRLLADLMPAKISNANADGTFIYFNKEWLDFSGLGFEELRDLGYHKMMHPDEVEEFQQRFQQAAATGTVLEMEMRFRNIEGNYIWHLNLSAPVKDENGNINLWVGVTTEVQKQIEQREDLEKAVINRTSELLQANEELVQKNQEIAVSKYNKRFLAEFSEKFSAYKGHNEFFSSLVQFIADTTFMDYVFVGKLVGDEKVQSTIETIALNAFGNPAENISYSMSHGPCELVIKGISFSFPDKCRKRFPKNKTIEKYKVEGYLAFPLHDELGKTIGLIAVMHQKEIADADIVSSVLKIVAKRAEIELERIKNEEQLVQHNIILEEKNEELLTINTELQAFTYVSSHDLQEPLRKIQNFISHLLEKESHTLSERGNDYFRRIQESAKRMQTLIQDLLAFSHINNTERIFEIADLQTIIEKVKVDLAEIILEKNATIEAGEMCSVKIIPFLFNQLFYNLISNSLKFSIPGKPAHISIKSKIDEGINFNNERPALLADRLTPKKRYCHISLTDNGIGFDQQYSNKIFELFQRLHGKEEYPGTGVGLAIVKKIVDNHNGIITATGEINKGARFDIYIPV